jgi:hypothetical protein
LAKIKKESFGYVNSDSDMDPLHKPILVVGAARSGTYLLASILEKNLAVSYVGEVNELWKKYTPRLKCDFIPARCATPEVVKQTREALASHCRTYGDGKMLEKTPANALRLPFVKKVFPDAVLIHIIRDGRDAALSCRRKYRGDNRKVTKVGAQKKGFVKRAKQLASAFSGKVSSGLTPRDVLANPRRYWQAALRMLEVKQDAMWGPRFPGFEAYYKSCSHLQTGAIQWKSCVEAVRNFSAARPDETIYEVRYEELLDAPETVLGRLLDFIERTTALAPPDEIEHEITTRGTTWRDELGEEELEGIACHIEGLLQGLGYESSFRH